MYIAHSLPLNRILAIKGGSNEHLKMPPNLPLVCIVCNMSVDEAKPNHNYANLVCCFLHMSLWLQMYPTVLSAPPRG